MRPEETRRSRPLFWATPLTPRPLTPGVGERAHSPDTGSPRVPRSSAESCPIRGADELQGSLSAGVSTGKALTLSVQGSKTKAAVDSESGGFDIWSPPV